MIYFDNSATTSVRPEVVRVYTKIADSDYGNPDSLHQLGRKVHATMEKARAHIAGSIGVKPEEIIFTAGGSEANSLAIIGYALANTGRGKHVLLSNVEHSSSAHAGTFLENLGYEVEYLPVNEQGIITPELVREHLRKDTILVSLMHVNNEMGAVSPIGEIADVVHENPTAAFHADCVQSFGKVDIPFAKLDMASVSAHKLHGLKGSGFLMKKSRVRLVPLIQGGQQEQGLRGGTENAPANIALAKTVRLALEEQETARQTAEKIRDYLKAEIAALPGSHILSPEAASPFILTVAFDAITSEVLCNALDEKGVCVSARSSCSSHYTGANPVLLAMGWTEDEAGHSIRLSFSGQNTLEEAEAFMKILKEILKTYGLPL